MPKMHKNEILQVVRQVWGGSGQQDNIDDKAKLALAEYLIEEAWQADNKYVHIHTHSHRLCGLHVYTLAQTKQTVQRTCGCCIVSSDLSSSDGCASSARWQTAAHSSVVVHAAGEALRSILLGQPSKPPWASSGWAPRSATQQVCVCKHTLFS